MPLGRRVTSKTNKQRKRSGDIFRKKRLEEPSAADRVSCQQVGHMIGDKQTSWTRGRFISSV